MKRINYELKQTMKSKTFIIAFVFTFVFCFTMVGNVESKNKGESLYGYKDIVMTSRIISTLAYIDLPYYANQSYINNEEYETYLRVAQDWQLVNELAIKAAKQNDWQQYNHYALINFIYLGEYSLTYKDLINDSYDYLLNLDYFEYLKELYLPDTNIQFPYTEFDKRVNLNVSGFINFLSAQRYSESFNSLVTYDLAPQNQYAMGSVELWFHYIHLLFPTLIILLSLVFLYESYYLDRKNGCIKTLISIGKRSDYLRSKFLANTVKVFICLCIPICIISTFLFMFDHGDGIHTPMLSYQEGITSFEKGYNTLKEQENIYTLAQQGIAQNAIPKESYWGMVRYSNIDINKFVWYPDNSLVFISLGRFLMQCFLLSFLFMMFIISFISLFMSLINDKIKALFIGGLICIGAYALAPVTNTSSLCMFNPFQYIDSTLIVGGTSAYPYLSGVCVLIGWTCIIVFINIKLFKRKDIV